MIAIATKFLPVTNHRGARIKAWRMDEPKVSVTISYDYSGNDQAHDAAAKALCEKFGWHGTLVRGYAERGRVYVWQDADAALTV